MLVYTYQNEAKVKELNQTGEFKITKNDFDFTYVGQELLDSSASNNIFSYPYKFMWECMKERLGKCSDEDVILPIWVWYRYNGRRKPSKKHEEEIRNDCKKSGVVIYRIDLEVDEKDILLSDFDMWCTILAGGIITEYDNYEVEDPLYLEYASLPYGSKEKEEIEKYMNSKIFNYNHKEDGYCYFKSSHNSVQGCLYKVTKEQVKNIVKISD